MKDTLLIKENTSIGNIVTSNIEVCNTFTLSVIGIVDGDIKINNSATVVVYGTVNGNIINNGLCQIFGRVNGSLVEMNGRFEIDKHALINSKI